MCEFHRDLCLLSGTVTDKSSKRRRHFVFFGISDRFDLKVRENLVYCAVEIKHSSDLRTN